MRRFIHAKTFDVRPVEYPCALIRHPVGIQKCLEGNVASLRTWFDLIQQRAQWKADPWNNHRPPFHTPQPVNALFQREFQQLIQIKYLRFVD